MSEPLESRCAECVELGIECPMDYAVEKWRCDVCGASGRVVVARCCLDDPPCSVCGSESVTVGDGLGNNEYRPDA